MLQRFEGLIGVVLVAAAVALGGVLGSAAEAGHLGSLPGVKQALSLLPGLEQRLSQPPSESDPPLTSDTTAGQAGGDPASGQSPADPSLAGDSGSPPPEGEPNCVSVLKDQARAYVVLSDHVDDSEFPEGGQAGNANALDKLCRGYLSDGEGGKPALPSDTPGQGPGRDNGHGQSNGRGDGRSNGPPASGNQGQGSAPEEPPGQKKWPSDKSGQGQQQGQGKNNENPQGQPKKDKP